MHSVIKSLHCVRESWRVLGKLNVHGKVLCSSRNLNSKVPDKPTWLPIDTSVIPEVPPISDEMVEHLERHSLVQFSNKEGVERLYTAIEYANQLYVVNTDGVEPLTTVLEDFDLELREDCVTEGGNKAEVLQNASVQEEDYYVAPPGNIPLNRKQDGPGLLFDEAVGV